MQGTGRSTRVSGCRFLRYLRHRDIWLLKVGWGEEGDGIDGMKMECAGLDDGVTAWVEWSCIRVHQVVCYRESLLYLGTTKRALILVL